MLTPRTPRIANTAWLVKWSADSTRLDSTCLESCATEAVVSLTNCERGTTGLPNGATGQIRRWQQGQGSRAPLFAASFTHSVGRLGPGQSCLVMPCVRTGPGLAPSKWPCLTPPAPAQSVTHSYRIQAPTRISLDPVGTFTFIPHPDPTRPRRSCLKPGRNPLLPRDPGLC